MILRMNITIIKNLTILFIALAFISSQAVATECNINEENNYFNKLPKDELSSVDKIHLQHFSKRLIGSWKGNLEETLCRGHNEKTLKEIQNKANAAVEIEASSKNDELKFHADLDYGNRKTVLSDNFLGNKNILFFNLKNENSLELHQKFYRYNNNGGSTLVERRYKLQLNRNTIDMTVDYYSNGYLDATQRWFLTKTR